MKTKNLYPTLNAPHAVPSQKPFIETYLHERYARAHQSNGHYRIAYVPAVEAIKAARFYFEPANGGDIYGGKYKFAPRFARGFGSNSVTESGKLWITDTDCAGLRFVGYADDVGPIDHKGWFLHEDIQDEKARGAVFQRPARNGRAQYVAAMEDPYNAGAYLVDIYTTWEGAAGGAGEYDTTDDDGIRGAAIRADDMANAYAEEAREYSKASDAGDSYATAREEAKDARKEARDLLGDVRKFRREVLQHKIPHAESAICAALHSARRAARKADKKARAMLEEFEVPHGPSRWRDERARLAWAFAESAGMDETDARRLLLLPAPGAV